MHKINNAYVPYRWGCRRRYYSKVYLVSRNLPKRVILKGLRQLVVAGEVVSEENAGSRTKEITIKGLQILVLTQFHFTARLKVEEGQIIDRGDPLTEGSIDLRVLRVRDVLSVENYAVLVQKYTYARE